MPDVLINNQRFYNPVDFILQQIGGTWKAPVLWRLKSKSLRYTELEKDIPHISQKMLTKTLRELEANGIIDKKIFAEVPPHTEYSITEKGKKIIILIASIRNLGVELMKDEGIDYDAMVREEKKNAVKK
jgi:DNA-binding HxlR family transcriptional regulator